MKKQLLFPLGGNVFSLKKVTLMLAALVVQNVLYAQNSSCVNSITRWWENFGQGTTNTSHPAVPGSVNYIAGTAPLALSNEYRISNNTQQGNGWHNAADHSGNANGRMLVMNGQAGTFFVHEFTQSVPLSPGTYYIEASVMNLYTPQACGATPFWPQISFDVEYQTASGAWVHFNNSPANTAAIPVTVSPQWNTVWGSLELPLNIPSNLNKVRVTVKNLTPGGCGNFFAIDDINFAYCAESGPLPVNFLDIKASLKNTRVLVEWQTAFEVNNKYFEVERSTNGINWVTLGRIESKGSSQLPQAYNFADTKPAIGTNIYRIRQYDINYHSTMSKNTSVKVNIEKTSATVVANPFINNLSVEFLSNSNQQLNARLFDITGKLVSTEKWSVGKGSTVKSLLRTSGINAGIYILSITGETNEILYQGKVVKQ